jgi:hypothetical protein
MSEQDYEGQQLYKLVLKEGEEPEVGNYYEAFVVCADTERKAWLAVQAYLKENPAGNPLNEQDPRDWLKGAKKVICDHIGEAFDHVKFGVIFASFISE